jgi:aryl sulfotransferase
MKYTDLVQEGMSAVAESQGRAIRFDYANKREFWQDWISKGSFDWEQDGFPYWSHFHHAQTWWNFRHLPNILSVHFADLLRDPEAEIRRIAAFLDIEIQEDHFPSVLERVTFGEMKKDFERIFAGSGDIWQGGEKTFMNKGTNGRWRDVLTQEDLAQYDEAVAKVLTPDCAKWLENGGHPA